MGHQCRVKEGFYENGHLRHVKNCVAKAQRALFTFVVFTFTIIPERQRRFRIDKGRPQVDGNYQGQVWGLRQIWQLLVGVVSEFLLDFLFAIASSPLPRYPSSLGLISLISFQSFFLSIFPFCHPFHSSPLSLAQSFHFIARLLLIPHHILLLVDASQHHDRQSPDSLVSRRR